MTYLMNDSFVGWYLFSLLSYVLQTFSILKADNVVLEVCELELHAHCMYNCILEWEEKKIMIYFFNI